MGGRKSKLNKREIEQLVNKTNFTADEIKTWYNGFLRDCPTGKLYRSEFTKIYVQFFPRGDPTHFAKYVAILTPLPLIRIKRPLQFSFVFNVFDNNGDGYIEFAEFLQALSITSRGKLEDKLEWAFKLYDLDNDGHTVCYITATKMPKILFQKPIVTKFHHPQ